MNFKVIHSSTKSQDTAVGVWPHPILDWGFKAQVASDFSFLLMFTPVGRGWELKDLQSRVKTQIEFPASGFCWEISFSLSNKQKHWTQGQKPPLYTYITDIKILTTLSIIKIFNEHLYLNVHKKPLIS